MEQETLSFEYYATRAEVQRLENALHLACRVLWNLDAIEYSTNPERGTSHTPLEWVEHFMSIAGNTEESR